MSRRRAVWLVARREIVERLRDRSLLISTVVTLVILAAIVVLPQALGLGGKERYTVAVSGPQAERVAAAAQRTARAVDAEIEIDRLASPAAVRRAVSDDEADAGLTGAADRIVVRDELEDELGIALQEASRLLRLEARPPPALPVTALEGSDDSGGRVAIAFVAVFLLYGQLIGYGYWVTMGIVEEKSSRIVEVLLATIRPRDLLAGKVLGIGVVGLGQLLLIGVVGAALGVASGAVDATSDLFSAVPVVLAWFLLGYCFYACLFAVAGALVPRQEEVQNVTGPLLLMLIGAFVLSFTALEDPSGGLATVLSYVPPTAPMIMPVRLIAGEVPVEQVLASVAAILVCTVALIGVAARVYSNAVLRTGTRVKLIDAWRATQT